MPNKATTSYKNQHHTIYTFNNTVDTTIKTFRMKSPGGPLQVPSCLGPGSSSLVFPGDVPSASYGYTGEQLNPDNCAPPQLVAEKHVDFAEAPLLLTFIFS